MSASSLPQRKSPRLPDFDYSSDNSYFVTICSRNRECLFGTKQGENIILSRIGNIAEQCWQAIPQHFPDVHLDAFVMMPNHLHGILILSKPEQLPPISLGQVINSFKGADTRIAGVSVWQPRYHVTSSEIKLVRTESGSTSPITLLNGNRMRCLNVERAKWRTRYSTSLLRRFGPERLK